jgi:hypothetical protein
MNVSLMFEHADDDAAFEPIPGDHVVVLGKAVAVIRRLR